MAIATTEEASHRKRRKPYSGQNLDLDLLDKGVLEQEVPAFAASLTAPDARARYEQLSEAVSQGSVPAALVPPLETMLELVLQTQRVRREHGVEAEQALLSLYQSLPAGQAARAAAGEVNDALRALHGKQLDSIAFTPVPGGQKLSLRLESYEVSLTINRGGVQIDRVEAG